MTILNKINKFFDLKNTIFLCLWFVGTAILLNLLAFGYLEYLGSTVGINRNEVLPNIPWFGKVFMLFFLAFLIPLWEEFVFRFWLGKKFSILTVLSLGLFLSLIELPTVDFPILAILYTVIILTFLILRKKAILQKELDFTTPNSLPYTIGLSSTVFAFGHFYYYQDVVLNNPQYLNLSLFLVLVTFGYLGLILSFIRLKFGFKKALIVHIFANFLATAPILLLIDSKIDPNNLENYQMLLATIFFFIITLLLFVCTIVGNIKMFRNINFKTYSSQIKILIVPMILLILMITSVMRADFNHDIVRISRIKNLGQDYKIINSNNVGKNSFNPTRIAIIDTPVYSDHLILTKNIEKNICMLENCDCAFLETCNHGTAIAGIISILNPTSKISVFGAINSSGISSKDQITKALTRIVEDTTFYNYVNISINTDDLFDGVCDNFDSEFTKNAKTLKEKGTKIFVSTGNNGIKDKLAYPACISSVIPVGSISRDGKDSEFSNYIKTKKKELGEDLEVPIYDFDNKEKFVQVSGTSYASAVAVGKE